MYPRQPVEENIIFSIKVWLACLSLLFNSNIVYLLKQNKTIFLGRFATETKHSYLNFIFLNQFGMFKFVPGKTKRFNMFQFLFKSERNVFQLLHHFLNRIGTFQCVLVFFKSKWNVSMCSRNFQ